MVELLTELVKILAPSGPMTVVLSLTNIVMVVAWWLERQERREAQKSLIEISSQWTESLDRVKEVLFQILGGRRK